MPYPYLVFKKYFKHCGIFCDDNIFQTLLYHGQLLCFICVFIYYTHPGPEVKLSIIKHPLYRIFPVDVSVLFVYIVCFIIVIIVELNKLKWNKYKELQTH